MLIEPTTSAANSGSYYMKKGGTLQVQGTLVAEEIEVQIPDGSGGWVALSEGGSAVVLSASNMQLSSQGASLIKLAKPATTNSVGVKALSS